MLIRLIENLNEAPIEPEDMPWGSPPISAKYKNIWRGSHEAGMGGDNNSEFATKSGMLTQDEYHRYYRDLEADVYRELKIDPRSEHSPQDEARLKTLQTQWADETAKNHGYLGIIDDRTQKIIRWFDGCDPHKKKESITR